MGRNRLVGGAIQIRDARRFFEATGDYRYVSMAIGASIIDPPKWALTECWFLAKATERATGLATSIPSASKILDRAVELIIEHEDAQRFERRARREQPYDKKGITFLSQRSALMQAIDELAPDRECYEVLKKAWEREQCEELVPGADEQGAPPCIGDGKIKTTFRIERVSNKVASQRMIKEDPDGPWVENPDDMVFIHRMINWQDGDDE